MYLTNGPTYLVLDVENVSSLGARYPLRPYPTVKFIQQERDEMIHNGTLSIGEPCAPFDVTRYRAAPGGTVETEVITVYGRKVPLLEIRRQMLTHHEKYMHLLSDADIKQLSEDDIKVQLTKCGVSIEASMNLESLQDALSQIQRTRHLVIWHDHATVLGSGYILGLCMLYMRPYT